jgi:uncharacterized protein
MAGDGAEAGRGGEREQASAYDICAGMNAQTAARVVAFLDAHHVASLATCGGPGPYAANVFYVREEFALLWVSDPGSRHSVDLRADPRIAATVAPDCFDMDDVRGVQISGHAHVITSESQRVRARLLLELRYPCVKRLSQGASCPIERYANMEFYRLEATRIVLIDNSRGFGHKETLELEKSHAHINRQEENRQERCLRHDGANIG